MGDALGRLWDRFVSWWNAPMLNDPYDPKVGDPFGDPHPELPPGGLDGWDDGGWDDGGWGEGDGGDAGGGGEGGGCFIGTTPVLMASGASKAIGEIAIGDQVMARDESMGATEACTVARTFRHVVADTLVLQLQGGEVIHTTAVHRFAGSDGGFVSAGELRLMTACLRMAATVPK